MASYLPMHIKLVISQIENKKERKVKFASEFEPL